MNMGLMDYLVHVFLGTIKFKGLEFKYVYCFSLRIMLVHLVIFLITFVCCGDAQLCCLKFVKGIIELTLSKFLVEKILHISELEIKP
jgi:hypothetical protein